MNINKYIWEYIEYVTKITFVAVILTNRNELSVEATMIEDQLKHHFNQGQLVLQLCCLSFLWNFGETPQDRKFLVSKDVFPLTVDALLLQPRPLEDTGHIDIASMIVGVNETAIGCCGG